ncbi:MAG: shikimate dehydrogenase [Bacteroidetes bacterium]|nr:shikimate dehydrogenase [Bacteroidota bacterium]MBS1974771.1 shikimate dehydrogenase [Bacteroidota bacterium]
MRKFGLIGYPLSHSFSQNYFNEKFNREKIADCVYQNFPIEEIGKISAIIASEPELRGLNVTIPYKEQVISFLDFKNAVVEQISACNCIKIVDGRLCGFNTDVVGFEVSLKKKLKPHHQKALILGTGGAAKAVGYVMKKLGIEHMLVSRKPVSSNCISYYDLNEEIVRSHTLIINTSPVGMYPNVEAYPEIPYCAITAQHYLFDLIYNPGKTMFLKEGEEKGAAIENGSEMLALQAEESWRIWNEG